MASSQASQRALVWTCMCCKNLKALKIGIAMLAGMQYCYLGAHG